MAENGRWDHESGVGFVVSCGALWKGGRGEGSFVWFFAWAAGGGVVETQSGKAIFCLIVFVFVLLGFHTSNLFKSVNILKIFCLIVFVCFFIGFNQEGKRGGKSAKCLIVFVAVFHSF